MTIHEFIVAWLPIVAPPVAAFLAGWHVPVPKYQKAWDAGVAIAGRLAAIWASKPAQELAATELRPETIAAINAAVTAALAALPPNPAPIVPGTPPIKS